MKKLLFSAVLLCMAMFASAQITGKIVDASDGSALIGATVMYSGSTTGTLTDVDGMFSLDGSGSTIEISYVGYQTMEIDTDGASDLGRIRMDQGGIGLSEVVIRGTMDIVQDRRTPVAVSTITGADIAAKAGNVEFPELMKSTPSIYVANQSGGYGDSEVFTRGFDQTNTAFLLNGQPINGMEDGKMYWSNWSGMTDVAAAVQVQRGLGSSKLAISSVGGTTNIIMKPTALQQGGSASLLYGNDNYLKTSVAYNTGMMNDKFGVSFLLSHWQGDGWADGTKGQGQSYFLSAGYKVNEKNTLSFLITGAPQWHDQNFTKRISDHFRTGEFNIKYNNNWGLLNGEHFTSRRNYYHKPVANLNWEMDINEKSSLSTVLYGSWGRGGGSGGIGNSANRSFTDEGLWDFDAIVAANTASAAPGGDGNEYVLRNSVNNHAWYGLVSTYDNQLTENLNLAIGADLRTYHGDHFREVRDLLGASAYTQRANARFDEREVTATFDANPWAAISSFAEQSEQIAYSNSETITYGGVFGQLEYTSGAISTYVQAAASNQSHIRYELFNETVENEESEKVTNMGYNLKLGGSYELNPNSSVYVNGGYYSRQPFHDNIFLNFSNTVNPVTENENITGLEAGYKYSNNAFALNVNVYRTLWENRTETSTIDDNDTLTIQGVEVAFPNGGFENLSDLNQLHQGVEVDFSYRLNREFTFKGFGSIGNWVYQGDAVSDIYDDERNLLDSQPSLLVDGFKVGGAAQTSFGVGMDYRIMDGLKLDVDVFHYSNLYSNIGARADELLLPSFNLVDLGVSYNMDLGENLLTLRANVFNALGEEYISRATTSDAPSDVEDDNWNGVNKSNRVAFGKTRTWNVSAKYSF